MKTVTTTKIKEYGENGKLIKETETIVTEEGETTGIPYTPSYPKNLFGTMPITTGTSGTTTSTYTTTKKDFEKLIKGLRVSYADKYSF